MLKIILAEINGTPELEVRHAIKLKKTCEELGLDHPVNVHSVEELIDIISLFPDRPLTISRKKNWINAETDKIKEALR